LTKRGFMAGITALLVPVVVQQRAQAGLLPLNPFLAMTCFLLRRFGWPQP
jgi:hypothetical protein